MQAKLLKDQILIKRQFQKSVRINTDLQDSHALDGFIPLESSLSTLNQMCHSIVDKKAFAFTWIGPFGSGKSTLALLLSSLCGENLELQNKALDYIQHYKDSSGANYILEMFSENTASNQVESNEANANTNALPQLECPNQFCLNQIYIPLCLVGSNQSLRQALTQLILSKFHADKLLPFVPSLNTKDKRTGKKRSSDKSSSSNSANMKEEGNSTDSLFKLDSSEIIQAMVGYLQATNRKVVLVIDELGKFLQNAIHDHDIYFLQEVAEIAARSQGTLICLGILHQSFDSYIHNFDKQVRDEWVKVQGRFENQVLHPSAFEIVNLIGASLDKQDFKAQHGFSDFTNLLYSSSPFFDKIVSSLSNCQPLHPLTALLLSSLSLKSYGQNERSIFGFMNSYEPHSFTSFLSSHDANSSCLYMPADLFDYIMVNQQVMLTHSPDGHQFTQALEILHHLENTCSIYEVCLFKTLVMICLLGNVCQIKASKELLEVVYADACYAVQCELAYQAEVLESSAHKILQDLQEKSSEKQGTDSVDGATKADKYKTRKSSQDQTQIAQSKLDQAKQLREIIQSVPNFTDAINLLAQKKAIIYRNYNSSFNIYGGSDFDFEQEFKQQLAKTTLDFGVLEQLYAEDHIILAKRHYMQTGNLRFMDVKLVLSKQALDLSGKIACKNDMMGVIYLTFVEEGFKLEDVLSSVLERSSTLDNVVFAIVPKSQEIMLLCREFQSLKELSAKIAGSGDKVAKQELMIHCNESQKQLQERLINALNQSIVVYHNNFIQLQKAQDQTNALDSKTSVQGVLSNTQSDLIAQVVQCYRDQLLKPCDFVSLASQIADKIFDKAPFLVNELINHNKISSNVSGARNKLLKAMCDNAQKADLGFTKAPPEASIYWTLFQQNGLHRVVPESLNQSGSTFDTSEQQDEDQCKDTDNESTLSLNAEILDTPEAPAPIYQFFLDEQVNPRYRGLFEDTLKFIEERQEVKAPEIFDFWSQRPYGIKNALHSILMTYFILVTQQQVALYNENLPVLEFSSASLVDLILVHADKLSFKYTLNFTQNTALLSNVFEAIAAVSPQNINAVCRSMGLPPVFSIVGTVQHMINGFVLFEERDAKLPNLEELTTPGFTWTNLEGQQVTVNQNFKLDSVLNPLFLSRSLVFFVLKQKKLTSTTTNLSRRCTQMRAAANSASDAFDLLFEDMPRIYPSLEQSATEFKYDLIEIAQYYYKKMREVNDLLLKSLKAKANEPLSKLNERAVNIQNLSADLELKGFINKLTNYQGDEASVERIINGCTNTPTHNISEKDVINAKSALQRLAFEFRKLEGIAVGQGRSGLRSFISFTTSTADNSDLSEIIELDAEQQSKVSQRANELTDDLLKDLDYQEALGVLAQLATLVQQHYK